MEEPTDIHEFHIIPDIEDQSRHWRNDNCWCEPEKGDPEDFPDIQMMECEDEDYVILVHKVSH